MKNIKSIVAGLLIYGIIAAMAYAVASAQTSEFLALPTAVSTTATGGPTGR